LTVDAKKVSPIRLVLETALDAAVIMGADGRVRDWNGQAEATFGWSRQEALGRPMADLIIPAPDRPAHAEGLRRHVEAGVQGLVGRRIEVMATDRGGRVFPVELSISRIDDCGDVSFVGFIRDVSDRLTAQQALKIERDRGQSVLDNMLDALVLMDRDLRVLQVNQAALRMEERSAKSMLGKTHQEIWPGPEAEKLRQRYREVLRSQAALAFEESWNDGRGTMWLEIRAQPTPEGVAVFYRDVTKRKTAEAVLRDSEARLRTLANVVPAMVWMSSGRGEVEFLNDRWFAFTGTSPRAIVDPASLLHPEDAVRAAAIWEAALKKGQGLEAELRIRGGDGQFRWFLSRSEPVLDPDGGVAAWIGASIDIDDRRRAQERLELMVNELNHRVKNNLAAVQALAAQTFRGNPSLPEAREAFTARLMALSRAHDILTRQQWEGAQLAKIATDVLAPNLPNIEAVTLEGSPVSLGPNAALTLSMAFHELCTNALKYGALSTPEGRVALRWAIEPSGMLHLTWTERGGPKVSPPTAMGFGSRLLTRSLAAELRGVVRLDFDEAGVVCTIEAPLDHGRLGPASTLPQII
jgi:PAS domain S-box-containing protein